MSHLIVMPVVLPALTALTLILVGERLALRRLLSVGSCVAVLLVAWSCVALASTGEVLVYRLGGWPAPYGIVLVLDRLAAIMLTLAATVALLTLLAAVRGWDAPGRHFHTFFQLQLTGLNGAFLTGDLFNLFVFFEVLLLASYCLLLHGHGRERLRAGVHYVAMNLATSALFLIGIGVLYGVAGTLNLADLALRLTEVSPADRALVRLGALLLLVVFGVKAALLPLNLWLPASYSAAVPPVAALFAIMTKVGIYAILRVHGSVFGDLGVETVAPWLLGAASLTAVVGALGACAARTLSSMTAYFTIASVGTTLIAVSAFTPDGGAAAVLYIVHSTLAIAALFLLAGSVAAARGADADRLEPGAPLARPAAAGVLLLVVAVTVVGMPPLSGFVGKLTVLESTAGSAFTPIAWGAILLNSFAGLIAFVRAGALLVWTPAEGASGGERLSGLGPPLAFLALTFALAVGVAPAHRYAAAAAEQLTDEGAYAVEILGGVDASTTRPFPERAP
jgi:multicomponent K+:H+ antiporter subunit D